MKTKADLFASIDADRSVHIEFLRDFLRAPSPNPPGDTRAAANVVRHYLDTRGVQHATIAPQEENPNIVAECDGRNPGRRLVMNGHIDVFPVGDAQGWTRDPWSGDLQDGHLHGRGAVDMKAGTAASIIAYTYLHAMRGYWSGSLGLTAVSDEETGGRWGSLHLLNIDTRWHGDCMINGEPGGLRTIRFAEKGTLRLTFTIRTAGAHGAYVHRSESATRVAAALISRLAVVEKIEPDLPFELGLYLRRGDVRAVIDAMMGEGAADTAARTTLNIGTIRGGLKVNMIPDHCVFEADIRLPIGLVAETVMERIRTVLSDFPQAEVSVQDAASYPATASPHDHPMIGILASNVEMMTGARPIAVPSLGASDCKHWRRAGVPAFIFGPAPHRMAMTDESVSIEEFMTTIKAHALAAWDYLGGQG